MQKWIKMSFAFWISVMFIATVDAAKTCSTSEQAELNQRLANISANYAENERKMDMSGEENEDGGFIDGGEEPIIDSTDGEQPVYEEQIQYYFDISLINLSDKFYVTVTNDWDNEEKTYYYSDSQNGIITFPWEHLEEVTTFTFKIYSSDATGCSDELQKTLTLRTPRLNENYNNPICEGISDYNLCQKYVTFDIINDYDTFVNRVEEYREKLNKKEETPKAEKEESWWDKTKDFVSDNKYYFIGGGLAILVITGVVVAVIVKKQRSSEL